MTHIKTRSIVLLTTSLIAILAYPCQALAATAPPPGWIWESGNAGLPTSGGSNVGWPGVYGSLGTPAATNMPGSRSGGMTWMDTNGDLWMFGGLGFDANGTHGFLDDVWRYSSSWTWMGGSKVIPASCTNSCGQPPVRGTLGVPAAGNTPGGRSDSVTWKDGSGRFWVFGGGTIGDWNDLWMFDPSTRQWAWMGGSDPQNASGVYGTKGTPASGNIPGARSFAVGWRDTGGNFWLFGGMGTDRSGKWGNLNDLWKYSLSASQWTWVSGGDLIEQSAVYGTKGTPAAANTPGSRYGSASWTAGNGHLWLFGGGTMIDTYVLNDLWDFDPSTSQWTWIGGSNYPQTSGVYGTQGVLAAENMPGSRQQAAAWTDNYGRVWLFGGRGCVAGSIPGATYACGTTGSFGYLNDLWVFDPKASQWAWITGSSTLNQPAVYGTQGQAAATNDPGARGLTTAWTGSNDRYLWLLGGVPKHESQFSNLNDLWLYVTPGPMVPTATPTFSPAAGSYPSAQVVTISDATPGADIVYSIDDTNEWTPYTGPITVASTHTIQAHAIAFGYALSPTASATYVINVPPVFSCHVSYTINSQWMNGGSQRGGFNTSIGISNTGTTPLHGWTLTWAFANGQTIADWPWGGSFVQDGANVSVTNLGWDDSIPAGTTLYGVGFNGRWSGANAVPTSFTLNGTLCN